MGAFALTRAAKNDLRGIARFTEELWRRAQRLHYLKGLDETFKMLTDSPRLGNTCDYIEPDLRKYPSRATFCRGRARPAWGPFRKRNLKYVKHLEPGSVYHHGYGVPQDNAKADYWYEKAATQGYTPAEYNLTPIVASDRGWGKGTFIPLLQT